MLKAEKQQKKFDSLFLQSQEQALKDKMNSSKFFKKIIFTTILTTPIFLSGCATVLTSNNISFPVKTDPEGAQVNAVRLHGSKKVKKIKFACVSPCSFKLRQDHSYIININKSGYKKYTKKVSSDASVEAIGGSVLGNVLLGGIVGAGVDAVSGADDRLFPDHLNVKLINEDAVKNNK